MGIHKCLHPCQVHGLEGASQARQRRWQLVQERPGALTIKVVLIACTQWKFIGCPSEALTRCMLDGRNPLCQPAVRSRRERKDNTGIVSMGVANGSALVLNQKPGVGFLGGQISDFNTFASVPNAVPDLR